MGRIVAALMALLFMLAAYLQLNDPDPVGWMAMYGAAALVTALYAAGRCPAWLAGVVTAVALAWSTVIAQRVLGKTTLSEMLTSWKMAGNNTYAEQGRELGGLLFVVVACGLIAVVVARRRRGA